MSTSMTDRLEDEVKEWRIAEIRTAIKEAEAGDFATDEEVAAVVRKWRPNACQAARGA